MTRNRILEASAKEIETNGISQFRVKRVAAEAGVSVALLYSYFVDREGLIAATMIHRYSEVLLTTAENFAKPLRNVESAEQLESALLRMISAAQTPERYSSRVLRMEGMAFARHNPEAESEMVKARAKASEIILEAARPLADKGLLAPGISPVAFGRIWYALFFGQIVFGDEDDLAISNEEWVASLGALAHRLIA